jgi:iron(III) transport system ATP-binding protein
MAIEFQSLSKRFDSQKTVLDDLNFSLSSGKFSGLLGPSGCGKTTLLRILAGLDRASSGRVSVDNEVWSDCEKGRFLKPEKRNVGMVFQSYAVWPHMNVFDNVAFPLKVRSTKKSEIEKRVGEALSAVHLSDYALRMPQSLSGGQQQRVALARALVQRPRVLLLDEPLSNLDASLRESMRQEIRQIQREFGITALIVTHDWADAKALCDEVVVLNQGRIEQQGSPQDLVSRAASDFVRRLVGLP